MKVMQYYSSIHDELLILLINHSFGSYLLKKKLIQWESYQSKMRLHCHQSLSLRNLMWGKPDCYEIIMYVYIFAVAFFLMMKRQTYLVVPLTDRQQQIYEHQGCVYILGKNPEIFLGSFSFCLLSGIQVIPSNVPAPKMTSVGSASFSYLTVQKVQLGQGKQVLRVPLLGSAFIAINLCNR